jgi:hypothetical protein
MISTDDIKAALFARLQSAATWATAISTELDAVQDAPTPALTLQTGAESADYTAPSMPAIWTRHYQAYIGCAPSDWGTLRDAIEASLMFDATLDALPRRGGKPRHTTLGALVAYARMTDASDPVSQVTATWMLRVITIEVLAVGHE